jgi:hypothetical protein
MRPKQTLLLLLMIGSATFLAVLLASSGTEKFANCQKKCPDPHKTVPAKDTGGESIFDHSLNHLIVSTKR